MINFIVDMCIDLCSASGLGSAYWTFWKFESVKSERKEV